MSLACQYGFIVFTCSSNSYWFLLKYKYREHNINRFKWVWTTEKTLLQLELLYFSGRKYLVLRYTHEHEHYTHVHSSHRTDTSRTKNNKDFYFVNVGTRETGNLSHSSINTHNYERSVSLRYDCIYTRPFHLLYVFFNKC